MAQKAIATLIKTEGSTYRKPGAQIRVSSSGELEGLLSGGCLENEIVEICLEVLKSGLPRVRHFDLRDSMELLFGYGLGCNGAVWVYIEPESEFHTNPTIRERWVQIEPEAKEFFQPEIIQEIIGALVNTDLELVLLEEQVYRGFYQKKRLPVRVCLMGAGPDVPPLVALLKQQGFRVEIYDHRESNLESPHFNLSDKRILTRPCDIELSSSYSKNIAVLMTHHFETDGAWLGKLIGGDWDYIGLLGPSSRREALLKKLKVAQAPPNLYAPAGIRLGGDGPEAIALSIAAEIQSVISGSNIEHLRSSSQANHLVSRVI